MAKTSRTKGKRGELEVVVLMKNHGFSARRDIANEQQVDGDIANDAKLYVEARRRERVRIVDWIEEVTNDAPKGQLPIVLFRVNGKAWMAGMDGETLMKLLGILHEREELRPLIKEVMADGI